MLAFVLIFFPAVCDAARVPPAPPPVTHEVQSVVRLMPGGNSSGLCLDHVSEPYDGSGLFLSNCSSANQWAMTTTSYDWHKEKMVSTIRAVNSNFCVDLPGDDWSNGNQLWLWTCGSTELSALAQGWTSYFIHTGLPPVWTPPWYIRLTENEDKCLGAVYSDGYFEGAPVQLWDCLPHDETTDQDWAIDFPTSLVREIM